MNLKEKYNNMNEQNKALVKMLGILFAIILIFVFLFIVIAIKNGGKKSNSQVELIMKEAAIKYVGNHSDILSDKVYGSTIIDVDTLVEEKYMKPLTRYYGKDTTCTGKVVVYKNLDNYNYTPKLDCGETYKTKSLYEEIVNEKNIVTEESGLYEYEDKYVYRGEYVDNYVSFAGQLWRIINITKDGEIRIFQDSTEVETLWDNRYNSDYQERIGINLFEATESSRLKESILSVYNNERVFTSQVKSYIIPKEYCVGKRSESDTSKDYSTECSSKTELMGASTFVVADFLNASLDSKCVSTLAKECYNYNYMAKLKRSSWTMTADPTNSKRAYSISDKVYNKVVDTTLYLRLVVTIDGNINYVKGTGTMENPYVIG